MQFGEVGVERHDHVALVEIQRAPHNFFDYKLISDIADAFEEMDRDKECRAIVLAADGKSFCAGANFANPEQIFEKGVSGNGLDLYKEAARLFACRKPVIGAIQGAAIGGGFGLALVPDFRVVCPETRFSANFAKLGIHPGFGMTHTLPRLVGEQKAALLFYTGRRIGGQEALDWGLADILVDQSDLRKAAIDFAAEIATSAPLGVMSVRETMRMGLVEAVKKQTDREFEEQHRLSQTKDHAEGVLSVSERRNGNFIAG